MFLARDGQFLSTAARHAVPVGGVFGRDWHPITEPPCATIAAARASGDLDGVRLLEAQRTELARANINPGDVFGFHGASLVAFGVFLGGVMFMLSTQRL